MVSDVPFGCFLSGGIDSSLNAKRMSEALGRPVETFSVGYKDFPNKNEFAHSRKVAERIGIAPHEILLDESHMREFLKKLGHYADDPVADQACFPLFWLSKFTRDSGVTVVQIGEGADELFSGYGQYLKAVRFHESWRALSSLPGFMRKGIAAAGGALGASFFAREYLDRLAKGQEPFWGLAVAFGDSEKRKLLSAPSAPSYDFVAERYAELHREEKGADFLKQMTYLEMKHRLPEFLLARADKMTMAHSVEGRVPFLDTRLVELAFNMPTETKIKGGRAKYILKKAAEGIIPEEIINREKQGFSNPVGEWLKKEDGIGRELADSIFNSKLRERNILNYDYVRELLAAHRRGKDQNFKLWTLITLSLWYDRWFS